MEKEGFWGLLDRIDIVRDTIHNIFELFGTKLTGSIKNPGDLVAMRAHILRICRDPSEKGLDQILRAIKGSDRLQDTLASILYHAFGLPKKKGAKSDKDKDKRKEKAAKIIADGGEAWTSDLHGRESVGFGPHAPKTPDESGTEWEDKPHREFLRIMAAGGDIDSDLEILGDDGVGIKVARFFRDNIERIVSAYHVANDYVEGHLNAHAANIPRGPFSILRDWFRGRDSRRPPTGRNPFGRP